jgi:hypothetical protein
MYRQKEVACVPEVAKCTNNEFASNRVVRDLTGMQYLMARPALMAIPVFRGNLLDTFSLHDQRSVEAHPYKVKSRSEKPPIECHPHADGNLWRLRVDRYRGDIDDGVIDSNSAENFLGFVGYLNGSCSRYDTGPGPFVQRMLDRMTKHRDARKL